MTSRQPAPEPIDPQDDEPELTDPGEMRERRKTRLALAYRIFGAQGWGALGDGHITARDPERTDSFWLARYGVPYGQVTVDDLVLVGPDGTVQEGIGSINRSAYYIHWPIHEARPEIVSAAHCHTPYGTPFSALVTRLEPVSQEACAFYDDHELFDDDEVSIRSTDGGKRIAATLGAGRGVILRNHGLLTVGTSVDAAVGLFALMERAAEVQLKIAGVPGQHAISEEAARRTHGEYADQWAWQAFQWLERTHLPDGAR